MNTRRSLRSRTRRAFTLIELLLVLMIVAILAGLVVPRFVSRPEQAKKTAAAADIGNLSLAINSFQIDCGRFPTNEEGLRALMEQPSNANGWNGPYLQRQVFSDPWETPYVYRCPGQHNTKDFDLFSCGTDRQEGGGDDIDNWSPR
jgi:general secretion pathway protein G